MDEDRLSGQVIGAAIEVHRLLGPGLLESVYLQSLARELELRGLGVEMQRPVKAMYKGLVFDVAYRVDLIVCGGLVVELKVVEHLLPVHEAQLLSYLRLMNLRLGLLMNLNVPVLKQGVKRVVNGY